MKRKCTVLDMQGVDDCFVAALLVVLTIFLMHLFGC